MTWLEVLPSFAVSAALLLLPGLAVGCALRLRGVLLWSAAGPLSVAITATSSIVSQAAQVRWSVLPVAALTVVAASVTDVVMRRGRLGVAEPSPDRDTAAARWLLLSWVLAAGLIGVRLLAAIGEPSADRPAE